MNDLSVRRAKGLSRVLVGFIFVQNLYMPKRMFEKSSNVCLTTLAIDKLNERMRVIGLASASLSCILASS